MRDLSEQTSIANIEKKIKSYIVEIDNLRKQGMQMKWNTHIRHRYMTQLALACVLLHAAPSTNGLEERHELRWLKKRGWQYPEPNARVQHPFKPAGVTDYYGDIELQYPNAEISYYHAEVADESMRDYACHEFAVWIGKKDNEWDLAKQQEFKCRLEIPGVLESFCMQLLVLHHSPRINLSDIVKFVFHRQVPL